MIPSFSLSVELIPISTSSKNLKLLSASSISRMITKHAMHAQTVEKASGASKHTGASNPELNTRSNKRNVLSEKIR